jgi:hypothetical protein
VEDDLWYNDDEYYWHIHNQNAFMLGLACGVQGQYPLKGIRGKHNKNAYKVGMARGAWLRELIDAVVRGEFGPC